MAILPRSQEMLYLILYVIQSITPACSSPLTLTTIQNFLIWSLFSQFTLLVYTILELISFIHLPSPQDLIQFSSFKLTPTNPYPNPNLKGIPLERFVNCRIIGTQPHTVSNPEDSKIYLSNQTSLMNSGLICIMSTDIYTHKPPLHMRGIHIHLYILHVQKQTLDSPHYSTNIPQRSLSHFN